MPFESSTGSSTLSAMPSAPSPPPGQSRRRRSGKKQDLTIHSISGMIEQIQRCESILADGLVQNDDSNDKMEEATQNQQKKMLLSQRLLAKVDRLNSLRRRRHSTRAESLASNNRNNNKCCSGNVTSTNAVTNEARQAETDGLANKIDSYAGEEGQDEGGPSEGDGGVSQAYPKHQDYCLCHKRKCQRCGCLCPCSEHACPGCGYTSRVIMTMRAVDGLKEIANAQKSRYRNGRMANSNRSKSNRKRFLLNDSGNECNHAVMVRVGGGFVPLVEYLKSHNKVVLSKFTRGDGSAFLSPWRPYYAGPLKKGRPRGIRYVDSVTQQLEEIIFANREAGKTYCVCP